MRVAWLLAASCLAGCLPAYPPDAPVEGGGGPIDCPQEVWCEDGELHRAPRPLQSGTCVGLNAPEELIGVCADGCAPGATTIECTLECTLADAQTQCYVPPQPARCELEGTGCSQIGATSPCTAGSACSGEAVVGTCACTDGTWACAEACADGLCGPEAVSAAMVGTWSGLAVGSWGKRYQVTFVFTDDGHYIPTGSNGSPALHVGGDGASDLRRIHLRGQTDAGAFAVIDVDFGHEWEDWGEGELTGIRIAGDRMTFRFVVAWNECSPAIDYDLTRL